jgi:hypothetical protein
MDVLDPVPGKETILGEPVTAAGLKELDEAEAKITKTRKKWKKWERLIGF